MKKVPLVSISGSTPPLEKTVQLLSKRFKKKKKKKHLTPLVSLKWENLLCVCSHLHCLTDFVICSVCAAVFIVSQTLPLLGTEQVEIAVARVRAACTEAQCPMKRDGKGLITLQGTSKWVWLDVVKKQNCWGKYGLHYCSRRWRGYLQWDLFLTLVLLRVA